MKTTATNTRLRKLLIGIKDEKLIPRPDFQRRLVWSNKHRNAFVRTVVEGFPFPEIYIAAGDVNEESGEGTEVLVDGQQRITTLYEYFNGTLKLEQDITPYTDLEDKKAFLDYDVVVRDLGSLSISEIKTIFMRINSTNYALNPMEINNARFDGEIKKFADELASHDFFSENKVFTSTDMKRMGDTRFALSLIITVMSTYFHRDKELESYLFRYNDEFKEGGNLAESFNTVFDFINLLEFDLKHKIWKKADLFSLIVEVYKLLISENKSLKASTVKRRLVVFYNKLDSFDPDAANNEPDVTAYVRTSRSGTNDRSVRVERGRILREVILG